ncbi:hypothetical protein AVEN_27987-1, partial [Araneus ventricosus]
MTRTTPKQAPPLNPSTHHTIGTTKHDLTCNRPHK